MREVIMESMVESEVMHFPTALTWPMFEVLRQIGVDSGQPMFVIGGFVRDFLLGRPCKDVDVVTLGSGQLVARLFAERVGSNACTVYENFGTALVKVDDYNVEFVGARKESYRQDSRKPIVENGTLADDQLRRDFSINAMSISLNEHNYGQLIDPFNGRLDLEQRILRTPVDPQLTFSDDPLRMLRAIRFAAVLDFQIAPETISGIADCRERVSILSMERIAEELNKLMMAARPSVGFHLLHQTGVLPLIFPELARMSGRTVIDGIGHKDNFIHTLKVLDNLCTVSDNLWLRWAALLHDIAKPNTKKFEPGIGWSFHGHEFLGAKMVPGIFKRLKLPMNEKMRYVQKLVGLHQRPIALVEHEVSDSAIRRIVVDAGEDLQDLFRLCRADITTGDRNKHATFLQNYDALEQRILAVQERDQLHNWQPPITGEIIMATFGISPSKAVGQIKEAVREAILEGQIANDYQQAFGFMLTVAAELGFSPIDAHPPTSDLSQ
jgi:poly(A) polymerase